MGLVEIVGACVAALIAAMATGAGGLAIKTFGRLRDLEARQNSDEVRIAALEETAKDVGDLKIATATILERLEHVATPRDLQPLHDRISENGKLGQDTSRQVAVLAESMKGVRGAVDRLHRLEEIREERWGASPN